MQIKRYEAKNMTMALRKVKDELGPDAVILTARSLRKSNGFFGSGKSLGVEVTAAVDSSHLKPAGGKRAIRETSAAAPGPAIERYQAHAGGGRSQARKTVSYRAARQNPVGRRNSQSRSGGLPSATMKMLQQQLVTQDVQNDIVVALIEELQRVPGIDGAQGLQQIRDHLRDLLAEMDLRVHPVGTGNQSPKLVAFVGPPGVGKTTTLAKLVTRHALAGRMKVALIGMDGYRIGAVGELRAYADILDVPLAVLNTPAALRATLKRYKKCDLVYLDTAGIGSNDQERLTELQAALAKVKHKEVHLLLNATTRERDLTSVVNRFNCLPIDSLGFTHLDECSTHGVLINMLSRAKLPMSIFSNGQSIPEDLLSGSLDAILDWVLKDFDEPADGSRPLHSSARSSRHLEKNRSIYVANRNSDVYHQSQCKWTRKIKPENMVEFATIEEAESQRYQPCRTCRPEPVALGQDVSFTGDRVTLTNYR